MSKSNSHTLEEAKKKLEHYCAYQERCHQEVISKLNSLGMISGAKDVIVSHLIEHNYLNETRFAQSFTRGKFSIKKWGRNRILRELKLRQISDYNIKKGMKEIPDSDYETTFYELFEKRKKAVAHLPKNEQKNKIISYLNYRGWEQHKIYSALNEIF